MGAKGALHISVTTGFLYQEAKRLHIDVMAWFGELGYRIGGRLLLHKHVVAQTSDKHYVAKELSGQPPDLRLLALLRSPNTNM